MKNFITGTTQNKDFNSFVIVTWAVALVFALVKLFPEIITSEMQTGVMVAVFAVLVNKVRESTK